MRALREIVGQQADSAGSRRNSRAVWRTGGISTRATPDRYRLVRALQ
jgi:hypothetical protein